MKYATILTLFTEWYLYYYL